MEDRKEINQLGNVMPTKNRDNPVQGRVYDQNGLSPTINCMGGGGREPMTIECECVGGIGEKKSNGGTQYYQQDRVYSMGDVSMCHPANIPGGSYRYLEVESMNGEIRGRGENNEQQIELQESGCSNTITSVQKDNIIIENLAVKQATKDGSIPIKVGGVADLTYPSSKTRRGRVIENGEICPTLTTESIPNVLEDWVWEIDGQLYRIRIRKPTPRECWRLMGFSDDDFEKAESVNSNTQLYKQAGNSIVKDVLCGIFANMF